LLWVTDPGRFRYSAICNCRHNLLCEIEQSQSPKLKLS
jgi:hypothetical protein